MKKLFTLLLSIGLILNIGCKNKSIESTEIISMIIQIDNSQVFLDDEKIEIENFEKVILPRLKELAGQGIKTKNIEVQLKADKAVKMGLINDLQTKLIELDVRKINYSTL